MADRKVEREKVHIGTYLPVDRHEQPEDPHIERILERERVLPSAPALPETKEGVTLVVPAIKRENHRGPSLPGDLNARETSGSQPLAVPSLPQIVKREASVPSVPELTPAARTPLQVPALPGANPPVQLPPVPEPEPADHATRFPRALHRRYDTLRHNVHWM